jgi:hypothetical protein
LKNYTQIAKENKILRFFQNVENVVQSLSLIQAIVLLHGGGRLHRKESSGQFVRNAENIANAKEMAFRVLGRNLAGMPRVETVFLKNI